MPSMGSDPALGKARMAVSGPVREHVPSRPHRSARAKHRWLLAFVLVFPASLFAGPARSAILYQIDPSYVSIRFVVGNMFGVFSTTGDFKQLSGSILLDLDTPQHSHVDVTVASASIATAWDTANKMLLSPAFLDPAQYPSVHFVSDRVVQLAPDHVILHGYLTLRGITRPQELDARLIDEQDQPGMGPVADFVVTGQFNRRDFGMISDFPTVSWKVSLKINAHIFLTPKGSNAP